MEPYLLAYLNSGLYPWAGIILAILSLQLLHALVYRPLLYFLKRRLFPKELEIYHLQPVADFRYHPLSLLFPFGTALSIILIVFLTIYLGPESLASYVNSTAVDTSSAQFMNQEAIARELFLQFIISLYVLWAILVISSIAYIFFIRKQNIKNITLDYLERWSVTKNSKIFGEKPSLNENVFSQKIDTYIQKICSATYGEAPQGGQGTLPYRIADQSYFGRDYKLNQYYASNWAAMNLEVSLDTQYKIVMITLTYVCLLSFFARWSKKRTYISYAYFKVAKEIDFYNQSLKQKREKFLQND